MRGDTVAEAARKEAEQAVGQKFGHMTVEAVVGLVGTPPTTAVRAKCDCGVIVESIPLTYLRRGKREYCNKLTCRIFGRDKQANRVSVTRKKKSPTAHRNGNGRQRGLSVDRAGVASAVRSASSGSSNGSALASEMLDRDVSQALGEDAALYRKVAVWLEMGCESAQIIGLLRDRANKLDRLVFGNQISEHLKQSE